MLAQSIAQLYDFDQKETDFLIQAENVSFDKEKSKYITIYEQYREKEGTFFYQNFLPTLISLLKDRSREERDKLKNALMECHEERAFILGESPDAYFDVIEAIIKNFDISPKTEKDTKSIVDDLKLQIANQVEAENEK